MARTRATIHVTALNDADFRALPALAKYLYWVLLAQSKLTISGCLDLKVVRWAEVSPDTPPELVDCLLGILEDHRYVAIDRETDELVIRTFVKHDVAGNKNSQRGVWGAWQGIESPFLRHVVVLNIPGSMWDNPDVPAPDEAKALRDLPLPDRPSRRSSRDLLERVMEQAIEGASVRSSERSIEPPSPVPSPAPATSTATVLDRAALQLGLAEAERRGGEIGSPAGYAKSRAPEYRATYEARWLAHLDTCPTATADELVALVLRPQRPVVRGPVDHTEQTAAAAQARYEANQERLRGAACETCDGAHVVETEGGCVQCPTCTAPTSHLRLA